MFKRQPPTVEMGCIRNLWRCGMIWYWWDIAQLGWHALIGMLCSCSDLSHIFVLYSEDIIWALSSLSLAAVNHCCCGTLAASHIEKGSRKILPSGRALSLGLPDIAAVGDISLPKLPLRTTTCQCNDYTNDRRTAYQCGSVKTLAHKSWTIYLHMDP